MLAVLFRGRSPRPRGGIPEAIRTELKSLQALSNMDSFSFARQRALYRSFRPRLANWLPSTRMAHSKTGQSHIYDDAQLYMTGFTPLQRPSSSMDFVTLGSGDASDCANDQAAYCCHWLTTMSVHD